MGGTPAAQEASPPSRRILLLYSEPRLTPALVAADTALRSTIESGSPVPPVFFTEYLDLNLFDGAAPQPELRELLRRKYATRPLDLIVAAGSRSLRIALHNRPSLFSDAPVVFLGVDRTAAADLRIDPRDTGTWLHQGWAETLDLARQLQPGTRRAVVVAGSSPADLVWLAEARRQLRAPEGALEVTYLAGENMDDVLREVGGLPAGTVVLVGPFLRDARGRDTRTPDAVARIAAAARVPIYGLTDNTVGGGTVGGYVVHFESHGKVAGELALRVLAGERPPATGAGTVVPMFDARQLDRWGIDARRLPRDGRLLFQEPSLWDRYRWYVVGGIAVVVAQSALIGSLLLQRTQRRRAQLRLAERLRFETLLSDLSTIFAVSAPAGADRRVETALWRLGEALEVDWATVRLFADDAGGGSLIHAWSRAGVPPRPAVIREDETPWVFAQLREKQVVRLTALAELPPEAAVDRRSLEALGTRSTVIVPLAVTGTVVGCLSLGTNDTERRWPDELVPRLALLAEVFANALDRQRSARAFRESEEQIRDLAGRLLTAQEEERRRIARDLHDGVNQELAAMAIALSSLDHRLPDDTASDLRREIAQMQSRAVRAAEEIRSVSHALHPDVLHHAGLVAALRGYCGRFGREHSLAVTFRADGDLAPIPSAVALCLYRVTQEGLGNIARHSGARRAWVAVTREADDVVLAIEDDGRGFDLAEARSGRGLGLISLDERVRLVRGAFTIDTRREAGTELRVIVPLSEAEVAARDRAAR